MTVPRDEHERTVAFAEIALEQIRALGQPTTPRNFEIWYHYATGYKPALNQSINETLAKKGLLSEADLEHTYDTYIATSHIGERIDSLGSRVLEEVKHVLDMVNTRPARRPATPKAWLMRPRSLSTRRTAKDFAP